MVDIIPIALVVDVVVPMASQMVVLVVPLMEVAQIVPLPLNLEDDVDMFDILDNMSNSNKV